jgi:hypothetical protein
MSWWGARKREERVEKVWTIDSRVLRGVPSVFTGQDTTYGEQRKMAQEIRDEAWNTGTERGLAISLLAVIEDFQHELDQGQER